LPYNYLTSSFGFYFRYYFINVNHAFVVWDDNFIAGENWEGNYEQSPIFSLLPFYFLIVFDSTDIRG